MSRIGSNTFALTASFFSTAVFGIVWYKIITNFMTQDEVGLFISLFATGAMLGTLTELGMPQVLVRFGARFDARDNVKRFHKLILFVLKVYVLGLCLMSLILFLGGRHVVDFLSSHLHLGDLDSTIVLLAYLALSSGTIRAINNAGFRGLRQMSWIPILEVSFSFLLTASYFTFRNHLSPQRCLVIFWICSAAVGVLGLTILLRLIKSLYPANSPETGKGLLREITPFWRGVAPSSISLIAVEQIDKILIPAILSLQSNAIFAVISRFANVPRRLLYQPMQVMNPEITRKWEQGRGGELRADLHLFIKLQLALGLVLMAPIAILAKPLISLVSTPDYVAGASALWVFCLVLPLLTMHQPMLMMLRAIGRVWYAMGGDTLWIVTYLAIGVVLARSYDLTGFVAGQVVASILVLFYTLWAFHRLRLPRPALVSFGGWLGLSIAVWGASVALGRSIPADFPWWAMGLVVPGCLVVMNILLVLGGFLNSKELDRTISLLAGKGGLSRMFRLLLLWPLRFKRGVSLSLLAACFVLGGCGKDIPHGCTCDDDVPDDIRMQIEAAADELFGRVKAEDAEGILKNAAQPVRDKMDVTSFVGPIAQQIAAYGIPEERKTQSLRVIRLKSGNPVKIPMPCFPANEPREDLQIVRYPNQASLVQWADLDGAKIAYSMLFWLEDGVWRLGAFNARLAQIYGNRWTDYEKLADEQARKKHDRNAGLLYNLALDLLVPNDWTRPAPIRRMEAKEKDLVVTNVPTNQVEIWDVDGTDYEVYKLTTEFSGPELGLIVYFRTSEDVADSLLMRVRTERLFDYMTKTFPEYKDVFRRITVTAGGMEAQSTQGFQGTFPLRRED